MKKELIFSVSMLLPLMFVTEARAEDSYPKFSGEIAFEIQNDWAHNSDDPDAEVNTLHTKIEPYLMLSFTERLSIEAAMVFEPVQDTDPGDDTIFENEGLFFEELKFVYSGENYTLFAGKFNTAFGTAWDLVPGIYGPDFA